MSSSSRGRYISWNGGRNCVHTSNERTTALCKAAGARVRNGGRARKKWGCVGNNGLAFETMRSCSKWRADVRNNGLVVEIVGPCSKTIGLVFKVTGLHSKQNGVRVQNDGFAFTAINDGIEFEMVKPRSKTTVSHSKRWACVQNAGLAFEPTGLHTLG